MKIKVITRHSPSNYGSLLQSIATIKVLESLGHEVRIIDYQREDERGMGIVRSQLKSKPQIVGLKNLIYTIVRYPVEQYAQWKFDKMRKQWLKLTPRFETIAKLESLKADCFMTGSDQVWGPMMNGAYDPAYFLCFVNDSTPKVAFAASFGKTKFDTATAESYQTMLARYDKISVRESSAVNLINGFGLNNCIGQVLDPTLMLSRDEWINLLHLDEIKRKEEYILLYLIHGYAEHVVYAKELAKKKGVKLLNVNPFAHRVFEGGTFVLCPEVKVFLSLIKNAKLILTDSFHGTCFSINMNTPFVELLPSNGTSTRNQSILELTGLTDRIVTDYNDFDWDERPIDYEIVNKRLQRERENSFEKLKCLLKIGKDESTSN